MYGHPDEFTNRKVFKPEQINLVQKSVQVKWYGRNQVRGMNKVLKKN